ncbi:hypothetical protein GC173_07620 [bacterium]|nr:hypothetical protein [bacterium]
MLPMSLAGALALTCSWALGQGFVPADGWEVTLPFCESDPSDELLGLVAFREQDHFNPKAPAEWVVPVWIEYRGDCVMWQRYMTKAEYLTVSVLDSEVSWTPGPEMLSALELGKKRRDPAWQRMGGPLVENHIGIVFTGDSVTTGSVRDAYLHSNEFMKMYRHGNQPEEVAQNLKRIAKMREPWVANTTFAQTQLPLAVPLRDYVVVPEDASGTMTIQVEFMAYPGSRCHKGRGGNDPVVIKSPPIKIRFAASTAPDGAQHQEGLESK